MLQQNIFFIRNTISKKGVLQHEGTLYVLIGTIVLITGLLYARDLSGLDVNKFNLLAYAIIPAVFMNHATLIYYTLFLIPLSSGLPWNYLYPLLILLMLIKRTKIINQGGLLCFIAIAFYELIHYGFYPIPLQVSSTIGYLTTIFFLCYMTTLKDPTVSNTKCIIFYCVGIFVFLFAIWYITQINNNIEMLLESGKRIGNTKRITGIEADVMMLNANPNQLGYISLTGTSMILVLYYMRRLQFWSMMLFCVVFVYIGALSVSRTWLLGITLLILLFVFFTRQLNEKRKKFYHLIFLLLIGIGIYAFFNNKLIYDSFSRRFTEGDISTAGSRITIFNEYNKVLMNNPFYLIFGVSAVHYKIIITEIQLATHNGIQQVLVSYGLIGLILFVNITVQAIKRNYRKNFLICSIPYIVAFFYVQLLNPYHNLYPFIVSFVAMRLIDDENITPKDT